MIRCDEGNCKMVFGTFKGHDICCLKCEYINKCDAICGFIEHTKCEKERNKIVNDCESAIFED